MIRRCVVEKARASRDELHHGPGSITWPPELGAVNRGKSTQTFAGMLAGILWAVGEKRPPTSKKRQLTPETLWQHRGKFDTTPSSKQGVGGQMLHGLLEDVRFRCGWPKIAPGGQCQSSKTAAFRFQAPTIRGMCGTHPPKMVIPRFKPAHQ